LPVNIDSYSCSFKDAMYLERLKDLQNQYDIKKSKQKTTTFLHTIS